MSGRSSILGFCVLAYALTWLCWLPLVLARGGSIVLPVSEELLATLGQFGPFAAAVLCAVWESRARGLRELLGRLLIWRVSILWFAVALLLPPVWRWICLESGKNADPAIGKRMERILRDILCPMLIHPPAGRRPRLARKHAPPVN